jgi:tetratricopeptide (TPR) repeat protein
MRIIILIILTTLITSCNSPEKLYREAVKLGDQEKFNEAIALLDECLLKAPDFLDASIQRGYYEMSLDKYSLAEKDFENALSVDPNNTLALYNLGSCKYYLGDYNASIKNYNKALDTKGGQYITFDLTDNPSFPNSKVKYDVPTVEIIYRRAYS